MKVLILFGYGIFFSISSYAGLSADCMEYAKKAISCYEKGYLADSYDETGEECGKGYDDSEEGVFWFTSSSINSSIIAKKLSSRAYDYLGGNAIETKCDVTFINVSSNKCSFEMSVDLGTEDGNVDISNFKCI